MKQVLIKQFEYSIPRSGLVLAGLKMNHVVANHLPLLKIKIDFVNGNLKLNGDWQFMMASNKHNDAFWFTYHRERIKIETDVCPALAINLNNPYSDGLVFSLQGTIIDGNCLSCCSGLLVIDNIRGTNGFISDQWNIKFYLYDGQFYNWEIKFKLPFYAGCEKSVNN